MVKRILLAACVSWCTAIPLGLLYAACASGDTYADLFHSLGQSGVVPVAVLLSTVIAAFMTPVVVWAFESGEKSLIFYYAGLFVVLSIFIGLVTPSYGPFGRDFGLFVLPGSLVLAIVGLVVIRRIHRKQ
jgi:hypothetical protein